MMKVGSIYAFTVKRPRKNFAEYVGTFLGESQDKLYFALADQPGVRLSVESRQLDGEPVEITAD